MSEQHYTTSDLQIAAYLKFKGLKIADTTRKGNKFHFVFEDPDDVAHKLRIEFLNSEFKLYANAERDLKMGLYDES